MNLVPAVTGVVSFFFLFLFFVGAGDFLDTLFRFTLFVGLMTFLEEAGLFRAVFFGGIGRALSSPDCASIAARLCGGRVYVTDGSILM
jgi:hypothetical protein